MENLFAWINSVLKFVGPLSDFSGTFPPSFLVQNLPLLGSFSFAIIVLVGSGIYFTLRLHCIQLTHMGEAIRLLIRRRSAETGISPLAAFMLSSAMRVGPGNILGVTGAISVGGPGALFWMWVSAFSVWVPPLWKGPWPSCSRKTPGTVCRRSAFYGRALFGGSRTVGIFLSLLYIFYALGCLPAQGYNVVSSVGTIGSLVSGVEVPTKSFFYYGTAAVVLLLRLCWLSGASRKSPGPPMPWCR